MRWTIASHAAVLRSIRDAEGQRRLPPAAHLERLIQYVRFNRENPLMTGKDFALDLYISVSA